MSKDKVAKLEAKLAKQQAKIRANTAKLDKTITLLHKARADGSLSDTTPPR